MRALPLLLRIHHFGAGGFWSVENPKKPASNSEIRRWMNNGAVHINGKEAKPDDWVDMDELESLVLFPKSNKRRNTIV